MPRPLLLCLCLLPGLATAEPLLREGDSLAICGDSITEQRMYSVLLEDYLLMCQPAHVAAFTQMGWSGETVAALHGRLASDVLPFRPSVVTLLYGMNDGGYSPPSRATEEAFEQETGGALRELRAGGARLILAASPCAVDPERFRSWLFAKCSPEVYNRTLSGLGLAARAAAGTGEAVWVDVHGTMLAVMQAAKARLGASYSLSVDGVHPGPNGQLVIAFAFLKAMGCDGDIGTVEFDAETGRATASAGHQVLDSSRTELSLESTRYPFCFTDDRSKPDSTAIVLPFLPFNEELNRFRLVVRHAPARMKISWGDETKVFTGAELAAGVNLAAAFTTSPFQPAFTAVETAIRHQQEYETPAVKNVLNGLARISPYFPASSRPGAELPAAVIQRDHELQAEAAALLRPVRHTLRFAAVPEEGASP
jgi:lysophospholipase L1-like esterase